MLIAERRSTLLRVVSGNRQVQQASGAAACGGKPNILRIKVSARACRVRVHTSVSAEIVPDDVVCRCGKVGAAQIFSRLYWIGASRVLDDESGGSKSEMTRERSVPPER